MGEGGVGMGGNFSETTFPTRSPPLLIQTYGTSILIGNICVQGGGLDVWLYGGAGWGIGWGNSLVITIPTLATIPLPSHQRNQFTTFIPLYRIDDFLVTSQNGT